MNPGVILSVGGGRAGSRRISLGPLSIARRSFDCPPDHPPTLRMTHWFISHSAGARAVHRLRMPPADDNWVLSPTSDQQPATCPRKSKLENRSSKIEARKSKLENRSSKIEARKATVPR